MLLNGETGTGKELLARAIHRRSPRRARPFVVVNCAAMPATLIESELFGHERGAFTGAHTAQIGRFELANGGTVFLDEIGELPLELQPKLLRVLQEGQVERLGSPRIARRRRPRRRRDQPRPRPTRSARGRFRRDLYYRLNVFPITLPPLRERRERHSAAGPAPGRSRCGRALRQADRHDSRRGDARRCRRHDWPGNVRELENVIQRAHDPVAGRARSASATRGCRCSSGVDRRARSTLIDVERRHIVRVLDGARWRIEGAGGAAQMLGMKPSTLRSRMLKLGVTRP